MRSLICCRICTATLRIVSLVAIILAVVATPRTAQAQVTLLSNLDTTPSTTGTAITSGGNQKAIAFTTGTTAYSLSSIQAYLSLFPSVPAGSTSTLSFALYTPSIVGGDDPGTLVSSLGTKVVNNVHTSPAVYTFTPASAFTLAASQRYVLLVDYVSGTDALWTTGTTNTAPTPRNGSGYNTPVYRTSTNNGVSYITDNTASLFAVNGTAVAADTPEPGSASLLCIGLVSSAGGLGITRRNRAKTMRRTV